MKLKLPNGILKYTGPKSLVLKKNSPTILFAAGVTGFVATTVLASRATLKLPDVLDEVSEFKDKMIIALDDDDVAYDQADYNHDVALLYGKATADIFKMYGPAIIVGGLSIAALTSSHRILNKRNAAVTAAYAALDQGFNRYRSRVIDDLGREKDYEYQHGKPQEFPVTIKADNGKDITLTARSLTVDETSLSQYSKFFDQLNEYWEPTQEYNMVFLRSRQNYWNDMLRIRGHVFLNEVYQSLGIEHTKAGAVVGWVRNHGDGYIDFGVFNAMNEGSINFVNGREAAIRLDFNVDGIIYDLMDN
jgi:hypothetical protein